MKSQRNRTATPEQITVGSTSFVARESLLVNTLFSQGGTANGLFKLRKRGVLFMKPNGDPFAFLVSNPHQSRFFVTCSRIEDGRIRYMFGLSSECKNLLGLAGYSHMAEAEEAERVWASTSILQAVKVA